MDPSTPIPPPLRKLFGGLFAAFGGLFLLVGLCVGGIEISHRRGTRAAQGTVVALERKDGGEGPSTVPVVQYHVTGASYRCKGVIGFDPPVHRIGETIPVRYDPARPSAGRIDSFAECWFIPLLFTGLGAVFAAVGTGVLRSARARDAEPGVHPLSGTARPGP